MPTIRDQERSRILKLARDGNTIKQIAARLGCRDDRVRRMLERAEQKGEIAAGTLIKLLTTKPRMTNPVVTCAAIENGVWVSAPERHIAGSMGRCQVCQEPTSVVIKVQCSNVSLELRFCLLHGQETSAGLKSSLERAQTIRTRFNGPVNAATRPRST